MSEMPTAPTSWHYDKGTVETAPDLLNGVSLPAAVVFETPLAHNLAWMRRFASEHGARLALLVEKGIAEPGDHVLLTRGDHMNAHGGTNTLKILDVTPAHRRA